MLAGLGFSSTSASTATLWSNSSNITTDDGSNAVNTASTGSSAPESNNLRGSNFDLSVPTSGKVTGVVLRVQLNYSGFFATEYSAVNIGKSTSELGTEKTPDLTLSDTPTNYDIGSSSDLWGLNISASEANSTDLLGYIRVAPAFFVESPSDTECDAMWIKIYYTVSHAPKQTLIF